MITIVHPDQQTSTTIHPSVDLTRLERPAHCRQRQSSKYGAAAPLDTQPDQD